MTNLYSYKCLFLLLVFIFALPAAQARELSGAEITSLFTDKTVQGYNVKEDWSFTHTYSSDGTFKHVDSYGTKSTGKWRVEGNEFCFDLDNQGFCSPVSTSGSNYRNYCDHCSSDVLEWRTFTEGNTQNL